MDKYTIYVKKDPHETYQVTFSSVPDLLDHLLLLQTLNGDGTRFTWNYAKARTGLESGSASGIFA